jgi:hypothetical protein
MFTKTKIALSTAIILGTASVTLTNYAFAEGSSNSEYGVWDKEWVVQGDTWIRRDELTTLISPAPSEPRLTDPKVRDRHP